LLFWKDRDRTTTIFSFNVHKKGLDIAGEDIDLAVRVFLGEPEDFVVSSLSCLPKPLILLPGKPFILIVEELSSDGSMES